MSLLLAAHWTPPASVGPAATYPDFTNDVSGSTSARFTINKTGQTHVGHDRFGDALGTDWVDPTGTNVGADYEVMASITASTSDSVDFVGGALLDEWIDCSSASTWTLTGVGHSVTLAVTIRRKVDGVEVGSGIITLSVA